MPNCLLWRGVIWYFSQSWSNWRGLSTTEHRGENWEAKQPVHIQQLVKSWELWSWQFGNTPSLPLDQAVLQTNSCLSFPLEKQRELGLHLSKVLQLWYLLSQQLKLQERPGHLAKWSLCPWSRMPDAQLTPPPASPWKTNPLWNLFGSQKILEYIPKRHLEMISVLCFSLLRRISLEVCEKAGMKAQGSHARGWSAWEWSDAGWVTVLLQG